MSGLTVDSWGFFESIPEENILQDIDLQIDAEIFSNPSFIRKAAQMDFTSLSVRNPVSARLNRLILESGFKLQTDYLESLSRQAEMYGNSGIKKVFFDFDLAGVLQEAELSRSLHSLLASIKGILYQYDIEMELLLRLPHPDMENFIAAAAIFRQSSMLNINYAVDMHIHEAGFDRDEICNSLLPIEFDTGSINFLYDAALGNKINAQSLQKIMDLMNGKGAKCDFFLCPSGNINYQFIEHDLEQWINLLQQEL